MEIKKIFQKIGAKITSERQTLEKISDDPNVKKALGIGRQKTQVEEEALQKQQEHNRQVARAAPGDPKFNVRESGFGGSRN